MTKSRLNLAEIEDATSGADHIENNSIEPSVETKPIMTIKNVEVEKGWAKIYKALPQPKLSYTAFCTLAIREKLESQGIIPKVES